jgi:single-stranded DNA-binding protein
MVMDLNLVVLCGRIAVSPELQNFESGASRIRLLLAVRSDDPARRLDLIPVLVWKPPEALLGLRANERVWVSGMLQRRRWDDGKGRAGGVQVVAHEVTVRAVENETLRV